MLWGSNNMTGGMGANTGGGGLFAANSAMGGANNTSMNNPGFGTNPGTGIFGNQPMQQGGNGVFPTGFNNAAGQTPTMNASPSFGLNNIQGNSGGQTGGFFNQPTTGTGMFNQQNTGMGGNTTGTGTGGLFASNTSNIAGGFGNNNPQNPFGNTSNSFFNKSTTGFAGFGQNNTQPTQNIFSNQTNNQQGMFNSNNTGMGNTPGLGGMGTGMGTGMGLGTNTSGNIFGNNTSSNVSMNNTFGNTSGNIFATNMGNNMGGNMGGGNTSSPFNTGVNAFNNPLNKPFGTNNTFGNNNTLGGSSSFNSAGFNQPKPGKRFQPTPPKNPKAANTKQKTISLVACITNQDDFALYSKEEIRIMYMKNPSMFQNDQQMQQTASMMGGSTNLFNMQNNTGMMGNTGMGNNMTGTMNTLGGNNIFGSNNTMGNNLLGNNPMGNNTMGNNVFGGNTFGNNTFGNNSGNQPGNVFNNTSTTGSNNLFGNSAFGSAAAAATNSFTQPNNTAQTGNLFSTNTGQQQSNLFGQNNTMTSPFNQQTNTRGTNLFESTPMFGQNTANTANVLNSTQQTIQQGNQVAMALFQNTTTPGTAGTGLFSQSKPPTSTGLFSQPITTPSNNPSPLFGTPQQSNNTGGNSIFGSNNNLFGQNNQTAAKPATPSNSLFGSNLFSNTTGPASANNTNTLFTQPAANPLNNPILQSAINTTMSFFSQSQGGQQVANTPSLPGSLFAEAPSYSVAGVSGISQPGRKKVFSSTDKNIEFFDKYALPRITPVPEYKEEEDKLALLKNADLATPGFIRYSKALNDDLFGLYKGTADYDRYMRDMSDISMRTIKVPGPIEFEKTRLNMERKFNNDIIDSKNFGFKSPDYSSLDVRGRRSDQRSYNDYRPEYIAKRLESRTYKQPPVFQQWENNKIAQTSSKASKPKVRQNIFEESNARAREPEPQRRTEQATQDLVPIGKVPICTKLQIKPSLVELSRLSEQQLSRVPNVQLSNQFGKLIWTKAVNLVGVDLDKLVDIQESCIELDESLSKGCELHFYNFGDWKKKKQQGDKVKEKFSNKMRRWLLQKKLKMISWDEQAGQLVAQYEG